MKENNMKEYAQLSKDLVTTGQARKLMNLASRSTVGYHISRGNIRYIWIDEGTPSAIRLLLLEDVKKFT